MSWQNYPRHALVRTNNKEEEFVGRCIRCGREGLLLDSMMFECPNTSGLTDEQIVKRAMPDWWEFVDNAVAYRKSVKEGCPWPAPTSTPRSNS